MRSPLQPVPAYDTNKQFVVVVVCAKISRNERLSTAPCVSQPNQPPLSEVV
uniref:Uncharacterized protein n=1 Tax=Anopheles arabiensis TaxID=7173 RepID=A0A182IHJ3_ANOAR